MDFSTQVWSDITPILQIDSPCPLVPINYDQAYEKSMNYCRALLAIPEYSIRALDLTTAILTENASHYSIWKYRLDIIHELNSDLQVEWIFLNTLAGDNPKSFQVWHHRRLLATQASSGIQEMDFINRMITNDSKNYHAWAYRQWVVDAFDLWDREMAELEGFVDDDLRNNSVWNQRFFVIKNRPLRTNDRHLDDLTSDPTTSDLTCDLISDPTSHGISDPTSHSISDDVFRDEIEYSITKIRLAPHNECPWNYIQGSLNLTSLMTLYSKNLAQCPVFHQVCLEYAHPDHAVRFALVALLNLYEVCRSKKQFDETLQVLIGVDGIRANYYRYRAAEFDSLNANAIH